MIPSLLNRSYAWLLPTVLFSSPAVASTAHQEGQTVPWWSQPGETDTTAFSALVLLFLAVFAIVHLYARFDRFAERHNEGTPLQTTIPTLLMIAFAYEIFPPLRHFSMLLPLALIAAALARDLMLWFEPMKQHKLKGELEDVLLEELHEGHEGGPRQDGDRTRPMPGAKAEEQNATAHAEAVAGSADAQPAAATTRAVKSPGGTGND
ncbi:MAG: hypothetical protein AAGF59_07850 [Pseudomonadota bacterium]